MCALLCIINSNSSLILLYFASVLGVSVYWVSSGSGLSQPLEEPLCSFLLRAWMEIWLWIRTEWTWFWNLCSHRRYRCWFCFREVHCTRCTWAAPYPCLCWHIGTVCWCCWRLSELFHSRTKHSIRKPFSLIRTFASWMSPECQETLLIHVIKQDIWRTQPTHHHVCSSNTLRSFRPNFHNYQNLGSPSMATILMRDGYIILRLQWS